MSDNRVGPSQPEKKIEQVQDSLSDQVGKQTYQHAGEQPANVEPTFKRDTTQWILQDINAKACLCNEESDKKNMCHCGKNQEKNVINVEKQQNKSDEERTNYFGEITFGTNHTAKYIRVHINTTKPKTVLKLMKEKWKLENPALLIYVHGSMKSFKDCSLATTCKNSLTKAVHGTGSWIITDGKQEHVNTDKTADEQSIIIGISQWGAIHNKDQTDNQQGTKSAECCTENNSLDPHRSHYILIDADRSEATSSATKKFREELEREVIKITSDNGVPVVLLLFQWDDDIKTTVYDAHKRNVPVVIVKESDKKASGNEANYEIPEDISTSKLTHICEWNVDSCESDLGLAIVKALSKAAKKKKSDERFNMTDHMYQLKLAVEWNMFGIAKNISINTKKQEDILKSCMMAAILLDKVEYVKLILDNDFDLKTFLTDKILKKLYNAQFEGSLFNEVLPKMTKPIDKDKKMNVRKHVKRLLDHVCESKPQLRYLHGIVIKAEKSNEKTCCAKHGCCCLPTACCTSTKDKKPSDEKDLCLDLFVWSVLNSRQDMGKLFWQRGKDPLAAALFADALLSAMSQHIDDRDFKVKIKKHRCEFTNLAIGILKEGYKTGGVNLAKKLLIQQQGRWESTSCVLLAINAKNKQFISEHACQDVFNNIWMGNIKQETGILRNNLKLLLCIFFPMLILFWIKFRKEDTKPLNCGQTDPNSNQPNEKKKANSNEKPNEKKKANSNQPNKKKKAKGHKRTIWNKFECFYKAPVIVCFHNVISYMIFLGLYSYSLMSKVNRYLSWQEILLCVWAFTIFTQEVIQVCSTPSKDLKSKLHNYIKDGWNILDIVTLVLFLLGMILRIFDNPQVAESALVVHGVNLITFYLRLLHIFSVHRELGPKLVMIIQMVYNIVYFLMILVVFIVAYGIASHSILYPHTEPSFETLTEIIRRPYWNIYGELMLDKFEGSADCTNDPALYNSGSYSRCPTESGKYFVPLLMGVYMLMCNILLLNLLIAMFSVTFQKVQDNSYLYWSYQQFCLIKEYSNRPFLAPPLIIFVHIWWLIKRVCCEVKDDEENAFLQLKQDCKDLREWENKMAETMYKQELEHNSCPVSEAVSPKLEERMDNFEKQLNWLVTTMKESRR